MQILKQRILMISLVLIVFLLLISTSIDYLFYNSNLFYQSFEKQISFIRLEWFWEMSNRLKWLSFAVLPIIVLLRILYTTIFLYSGIYFAELKINFGKLFNITLLADFVYVLSGLTKLIILIFFKEVSTLEDLQFTPLSIMELFDRDSVDPLFIYPLSLLNVFELLYFIVIAWLLVGVIHEANEERPVNFGKSLKLVTASYGSGLLLWVVFVMFISLNLT
jgi:hypothetical protein